MATKQEVIDYLNSSKQDSLLVGSERQIEADRLADIVYHTEYNFIQVQNCHFNGRLIVIHQFVRKDCKA
jgi:hypothetical protein